MALYANGSQASGHQLPRADPTGAASADATTSTLPALSFTISIELETTVISIDTLDLTTTTTASVDSCDETTTGISSSETTAPELSASTAMAATTTSDSASTH
ncbi:uncharacterized protein FTOL_12426 [Fusarium torulosum]|uniref:Uncharacterized protein n=1 Tax=Fusarium torulosum TaxID=33205 RepID=A0AAE8MJT5_9HYPO|nr:uncharacterized protein FTOL_12426 [Fusarium torulosum]